MQTGKNGFFAQGIVFFWEVLFICGERASYWKRVSLLADEHVFHVVLLHLQTHKPAWSSCRVPVHEQTNQKPTRVVESNDVIVPIMPGRVSVPDNARRPQTVRLSCFLMPVVCKLIYCELQNPFNDCWIKNIRWSHFVMSEEVFQHL